MRFLCVGYAIVLGVCAWSGCTKSPDPGAGTSETHFLLLCSDEVCGDGLSCICGACTRVCSADTPCDELASGATCMDPVRASCDQARSCDVECEANEDCAQLGGDHKCEDGRCRAIDRSYTDTTPPGGPGDGGTRVTYGPCGADGSSCGGGDWLALQSSTGQCICTVQCATSADCPPAPSGTAEAECTFADGALDGQSGECELPCDQAERCPDGAACVGGVCRFPSGSDE